VGISRGVGDKKNKGLATPGQRAHSVSNDARKGRIGGKICTESTEKKHPKQGERIEKEVPVR